MPTIHIHFDNLTLWALMELKHVAETCDGTPVPKTHSLRLALAWMAQRGEQLSCDRFWQDATKPMNTGTPYMTRYTQHGSLGRIVEGMGERLGIYNEALSGCYRQLQAGELPEGSAAEMEIRRKLAEKIRQHRRDMANRPRR